MKINVMDATKERYTNNIYALAYMMDEDTVKEIENSFQEAWDSGKGFTLSTIFGRESDSEAELNACTQQIQVKLEQIVKRAWVSQYSRDEIVSLLTLLVKGPQGRYAKIAIGGRLDVDIDDIVSAWNDAHPDMDTVSAPVDDYII